ncbi:MAG: HNH endonuclease family protein [Corynebacterium sp.]|nr:HNH endonuclease family protein [Corynebacterium sp.]
MNTRAPFRRFTAVLIVATAIMLLTTIYPAITPYSPPPTRGLPAMSPPHLSATVPTIARLASRPSLPGYERDEFLTTWAPSATPGCTVRDVMVYNSLPEAQVRQSSDCTISGGHSRDPYSGEPITADSELELDHVIPLSAAWDLGAAAWPASRRRQFANDPLNLILASQRENQAKSDQLPSQWMPSNRRAHCWYARRVAAVAAAYELPLPAADLSTMRRACLLKEL